MVFCAKCGAKAKDDDRFCKKCGAKIVAPTDSAPSSSSSSTPAWQQQQQTQHHSPQQQQHHSPAAGSRSPRSSPRAQSYASPEVRQVQPHQSSSCNGERCPACGGPTSTGGEKLVVSGKEWHRDCYLAGGGSGSPGSRRADTGAGGSSLRCGLPDATYGKQPDWAFSEQHKNRSGNGGQYVDGMFRR